MKITKCKDHFYGRKIDDTEVNIGISNAITELRHKLPDDFTVKVTREDNESLIKIVFQEDAYEPTCPFGYDE